MRFRLPVFFPCMLMIVFAIAALNITSYAQSVTISHNAGAAPKAGDSFNVTANPSVSVQKVVFYRNDVPVYTDSASFYTLDQAAVGQETYTYRARAYISSTSWVDSPSITVTVKTKNVFIMGNTVPLSSTPAPVPVPTPMGPNREYDHTDYIEHAIQYLSDNGGGTLFFPCFGGMNSGLPDHISIYNISRTIEIPSNITLQGESAEAPTGDAVFIGETLTGIRTIFRV